MIQRTLANTRGFLNIYFLMHWPFNEDDYGFCLGITINFGISKMFEINIIFYVKRTSNFIRHFFIALGIPNTLHLRWGSEMVSYE